MIMRKLKPIVAGQVSALGRRPVIRPLDDGIMAVPIPSDQRASAHEEMKDYIHRHKRKELHEHQTNPPSDPIDNC
jgi:hypothetical protein